MVMGEAEVPRVFIAKSGMKHPGQNIWRSVVILVQDVKVSRHGLLVVTRNSNAVMAE